jgi:hypothetical protein
MTAVSVKRTTNQIGSAQEGYRLFKLLSAMQADLTALRAAVVVITAKLDADATVTDTDYGAANPAALNTVP